MRSKDIKLLHLSCWTNYVFIIIANYLSTLCWTPGRKSLGAGWNSFWKIILFAYVHGAVRVSSCKPCWCLDTNRCDNINTPHFTGPQPAKCHIYVHKDIMTLRQATAEKKEMKSTFHSCCAVDTCLLYSSSAEDIDYPMLQQIIFMTKFSTDNELSSVLSIVSCGHCPDTSQWRGGPICTVCSLLHRPAVSTQYLLSIYSLATHKTFASHYPGSRGEMIGSWSQSDSCCPLYQPEVS